MIHTQIYLNEIVKSINYAHTSTCMLYEHGINQLTSGQNILILAPPP